MTATLGLVCMMKLLTAGSATVQMEGDVQLSNDWEFIERLEPPHPSLGPSAIDVRGMRVLRTFVVSNAIEGRSTGTQVEEVRLVSDG
jgi:hypothetical protein